MKRKRSQRSEGADIPAAASAPAPKTNFESKEQIYECSNCGALPVSNFSKSKINQYDRLKITTITCNSCTSQAVLKDENAKSGAKELRIQNVKASTQIQREIDVARKADPSAMYESDPLQTPIIIDAVKYFQSRSLTFKIHLGKVKAWRTIAKLAVRGELVPNNQKTADSSSGNAVKSSDVKKIITSIGLFQPGTHKVIKCLVSEAHHPSINSCVNIVSKACESLGIHGYIEGSGSDVSECLQYKSYLKYIMMAVERETNKVQLSLIWNTPPTGNEHGNNLLESLVNTISEEMKADKDGVLRPLFHSIWVNYNATSRYNNAITCHNDDAWSLLYGKAQIKEKVITDMKKPPALRFPPLVFRQANIDAFGNIVQNIRNWVRDFTSAYASVLSIGKTDNKNKKEIANRHNDEEENGNNNGNENENGGEDAVQMTDLIPNIPNINCVELYAGVGTIGLNCLDLFSSLHCSDENPHNKKCFDATVLKMSKNVRTRAVYESKGASAIARAGGLKGYDIVIVDPPRKGLDDEVLDALLTLLSPLPLLLPLPSPLTMPLALLLPVVLVLLLLPL